MRLAHLLRHPALWLLLLAVAAAAQLEHVKFLDAVESPDAISYELSAQAETAAELLSSVRTAGYPLLLRAVGVDSERYQLLPELHLVVHFLAMLLFWSGAARYTGSRWLAFAAAAPLLYPAHVGYVRFIQPDFLGPALAIASLGLLLRVVARPKSPIACTALALTTFLAYQMRPDYVFLVALLPLLGALLAICRRGADGARLRRLTLGLAAATLIPLLAFLGLRWAAVGELGLVPFGGYNMIGVTASFLDGEVVADLPEEQRPLANAIHRQRRRNQWPVFALDSWTRRFDKIHSRNVWMVAEPIARKAVTAELEAAGELRLPAALARQIEEDPNFPHLLGESNLIINRRLGDLARALIAARPLLYLKWVRDGFFNGLGQLHLCTGLGPLILLIAGTMPIALRKARSPGGEADAERPALLLGLCLIALSFFLVKLTMLAMVNVPDERFLLPAMILLPSAAAACLFELWRWILGPPGISGLSGR
jgi:hypothetical protein